VQGKLSFPLSIPEILVSPVTFELVGNIETILVGCGFPTTVKLAEMRAYISLAKLSQQIIGQRIYIRLIHRIIQLIQGTTLTLFWVVVVILNTHDRVE
jgi:hypothetical protein